MKAEHHVYVVLLCGLLAGCGYATVKTGGVEGVIFPADEGDFVAHATGRKDVGRWTPSRELIAEAFPRIKAFLEAEAPSIAGRLQQYRCQYFGIVVEGSKRLYCNYLHSEGHDGQWRSRPIFVVDGGDWYFQLEYDVESRQCLNLHINGEA